MKFSIYLNGRGLVMQQARGWRVVFVVATGIEAAKIVIRI